ncbi:MAG TPA: hypothetical protein VF265_04760 [Nevskiaceae bacterium]
MHIERHGAWQALPLIAYPPLAHVAVTHRSPLLMGLALGWLALTAAQPLLRTCKPTAWLGLGLLLLLVAFLVWQGKGLWLMVALSSALPALAAATFTLSLRPGATPLVTAIATRFDGPLPAEALRYTRRLTVLWAMLITALVGVEIALFVTASPTTWSRFANGYAYGILAAAFVLEYAYRRIRFRHLPQSGVLRYVKNLLRTPRFGAS